MGGGVGGYGEQRPAKERRESGEQNCLQGQGTPTADSREAKDAARRAMKAATALDLPVIRLFNAC